MPDLIRRLFSSTEFMPHGHCYFWRPEVVWLHVVSDSLIALSYVSIPITLIYFISKRPDIPFNRIFWLFGAFIVACGTTHMMEVWTLWNPTYWFSGVIKAFTATVSVATAIVLVRALPVAMAIPTPSQMARVNAELLAVETRNRDLAAIVDASDDAVFSCSLDGKLLTWNNGARRTFGYTSEEMVGQVIDRITASDDAELRARVAQLSRDEGVEREELVCRRKDGRTIDVSLTLSPLRNGGQEVTGASIIARDISDAKKADRAVRASLMEKEVLLKEIHHRVKNNLQVISSLLKLHAEKVDNAETRSAFQDSQDRVRSIALLHENLYRSKNLGNVDVEEYTRTLVDTLARANRRGALDIEVGVDDIQLEVDNAVPYGLILNELVTNALKHAFGPDAKGAKLRVELRRREEMLELTVSDNGRGMKPDFDIGQAKGLGMQLVRSLSRQLGATIVFAGDASGTTATLRFREHEPEES